MELNDILEKLSLPQDLTRRGFLNLQVVKRSLKAQKRSRHFS